jgi:membrane-bound lytic murein transglycosylase A
LYLRFTGAGDAAAEPPRLAFVQDQGAAITGPGRLDLYLGSGPEAGDIAGRFRAATDVYWLLPRSP